MSHSNDDDGDCGNTAATATATGATTTSHTELNTKIDGTLSRVDAALAMSSDINQKWKEFHEAFERMNKAFVSRLEMMVPMSSAGGGFGWSSEDAADTPAHVQWHGYLGDPKWPEPVCIFAADDQLARPGYQTATTKSEYREASQQVLEAKVDILAKLIKESARTTLYAGAGISTQLSISKPPPVGAAAATSSSNSISSAAAAAAAVVPISIPDYASSESGTALSPGAKKNKMTKEFLLQCNPSLGHRCVANMLQAKHLHSILTQTHDCLFYKAGCPIETVNEIHGSVFDSLNPIVPMSGTLRPSNSAWMMEMVKETTFVLCVGSSLSGMQSDGIVRACARRFIENWKEQQQQEQQKQQQQQQKGAASKAIIAATAMSNNNKGNNNSKPHGVCIVNLQKTQLDCFTTLRIFAKIDEVMSLLAKKLGCPVTPAQLAFNHPIPETFHIYVPADGKPIEDTRTDVQKSAKLARIANKMSQQQRQEIVGKLTAYMRSGGADKSVLTATSAVAPDGADARKSPAAAAATLSFVSPAPATTVATSTASQPRSRSSSATGGAANRRSCSNTNRATGTAANRKPLRRSPPAVSNRGGTSTSDATNKKGTPPRPTPAKRSPSRVSPPVNGSEKRSSPSSSVVAPPARKSSVPRK